MRLASSSVKARNDSRSSAGTSSAHIVTMLVLRNGMNRPPVTASLSPEPSRFQNSRSSVRTERDLYRGPTVHGSRGGAPRPDADGADLTLRLLLARWKTRSTNLKVVEWAVTQPVRRR